jgi:hypothetical protein
MFAAKIGPDGTLRWSRTYDVSGTRDTLRDVAPTPDGGALLVGELFHYGVVLAFKIDANGNVDWARMYGEQFSGSTEWTQPTVVRLPGGDFMLAGSAYNNRIGYGYDWVMRIDSGGNVRWVKSSVGVGFMVPLSDGNLLLVGGALSDTGFPDVAATKMTPDGVVQWRRRYGRRYGDSVAAAATVSDGGFLLAGLSSNDSGNEDLYLVRADATGSSGCLEQDLPPVQVTPIDPVFIGTPIVQATDVALAVEALPPSVGTLATQSVIFCSDAMAWRLSLPVVGDWNGDGKTDAGVVYDWGWGLGWYLDANGNGAWDGCLVDRCLFFGATGSKPIVGDWNGDGKTDAGVVYDWGWGLGWYLDANGNGAWDGCSVDRCFFFGSSGSALVGHAGFEAAAMGGWFDTRGVFVSGGVDRPWGTGVESGGLSCHPSWAGVGRGHNMGE